jgi:hypothetical protein
VSRTRGEALLARTKLVSWVRGPVDYGAVTVGGPASVTPYVTTFTGAPAWVFCVTLPPDVLRCDSVTTVARRMHTVAAAGDANPSRRAALIVDARSGAASLYLGSGLDCPGPSPAPPPMLLNPYSP